MSNGNYVAVWADYSNTGDDTSSWAVRAQMVNADGTALGDEFLVNTFTEGSQSAPDIIALSDGKFVITWTDTRGSGGDGNMQGVKAQIFNADGSRSGSEFLVNTTTRNNQSDSAVTVLADGKFVVAFQDASGLFSENKNDIRAQAFNADGSLSGSEFVVNTTTMGIQACVDITTLANGNFVVTWQDHSGSAGDTSGSGIRAQIYYADGSPSGSEFLVNTTTDEAQLRPVIAALSNGGFVITWTDYSTTGGTTYGIQAQMFNADGSASGSEIQISPDSTGFQGSPTVEAMSDGRFIVSWQNNNQSEGGTGGPALSAQVFNADGTPSGETFLVNFITERTQNKVELTNLTDDRVLVTYTDDSRSYHDDSLTGVIAQYLQVNTPSAALTGGDFGDHFTGSDGDDIFSGLNGRDIISGGQGADTLDGNIGRDRIEGGHGNDQIAGGFGNDRLWGDAGDDTLQGGRHNDHLFGGAGADTLFGDNHDDRLLGGGDDDTLKGGSGNDLLRGGTGADTLQGGTGQDELLGGADDDTFVFLRKVDSASGGTRDIIGDFATGDLIDISGINAIDGNGRNDAFTFVGTDAFSGTAGELRYNTVSGTTVVQGDTDGNGVADFEIGLSGSHTLTAVDFIL